MAAPILNNLGMGGGSYRILVKDGKVIWETATGDVSYMAPSDPADDCVCCESGCTEASNACTHCDDLTPLKYTVTFSGVNICGCTNAGNDANVSYSSGNLNGAFVLTQDSVTPDYCVWDSRLITTPSVNTIAYDSSDGTCGGAEILNDTTAVTIRLTRTATEWTLQAFNGTVDLYCDTWSATLTGSTQVCATVPSSTNDLTTCGGTPPATCANNPGSFVGATDGTATIVCVES